MILVGRDGSDLVFRPRTHAARIRLNEPDLRVEDGFVGLLETDTVQLMVRWSGEGYCVGVDETRTCGMGFTIGETWAYLLYPSAWPSWLKRTFNALWLMGLMIPTGFWSLRHWGALPVWIVCLSTVAFLPFFTAAISTPPYQLAASLVGIIVGVALRTFAGARLRLGTSNGSSQQAFPA